MCRKALREGEFWAWGWGSNFRILKTTRKFHLDVLLGWHICRTNVPQCRCLGIRCWDPNLSGAVWVSTPEKFSKIVLGKTQNFSRKFRGVSAPALYENLAVIFAHARIQAPKIISCMYWFYAGGRVIYQLNFTLLSSKDKSPPPPHKTNTCRKRSWGPVFARVQI